MKVQNCSTPDRRPSRQRHPDHEVSLRLLDSAYYNHFCQAEAACLGSYNFYRCLRRWVPLRTSSYPPRRRPVVVDLWFGSAVAVEEVERMVVFFQVCLE